MTKRILPIVVGLSAAVIIGGIAFAGGGMGGGMGGTTGGGHGMMGGHMMQYNPNMANPWQRQPQSPYPSYPYISYQNKQTNTEKLRQAIRAKRSELSDMYRSENPDKDRIDQKIAELNELEAELDKSLSGK